MKKSLLSTAIATLAFISSVSAVLVANEDVNNLSSEAPDNGAPWDNVLLANGVASSVYLGDGWVLTAEHVYDNQSNPYVTYGSENFFADLDEVYTLQNSAASGLGSDSDLVLFRLDVALVGLSDISLGDATVGSSITTIGFGEGKSWGTNTIDPQNVSTNFDVIGSNDFIGFGTDYDSSILTESQGTTGDSGGGAFALVNGEWQLVGLMQAVDDLDDPTITFFSNIGDYSTEINSIILSASAIPEPSSALLLLPSFLLILRRKR